MKGEACDLFLLGCLPSPKSRPNKAELETADVYGNGVLHYACMSRDREQVVFETLDIGDLWKKLPPKKIQETCRVILRVSNFFTGAT